MIKQISKKQITWTGAILLAWPEKVPARIDRGDGKITLTFRERTSEMADVIVLLAQQ